MKVFLCESCGGPMDAPWKELVVVCPWCTTHNHQGAAPVPPREPVDDRPRINLGGRTYVLEGLIGEGDSSLVYRARWVVRLGELVVIKVLKARSDADLFRSEWETLRTLSGSTLQGADHYVTRLPRPVAYGPVGDRLAAAYRHTSGFVHDLDEVARVHRDGVPAPVSVWLLKRLLELLGWVHRAGYAHGAVLPPHVLVHPRDHGAVLVGWTCAVPLGQQVPGRSKAWGRYYLGREGTPANDIAMACRTVMSVRRKKGRAVGRLLERGASGGVDDAWVLRDQLAEASAADLGPPSYNPLPMPGW